MKKLILILAILSIYSGIKPVSSLKIRNETGFDARGLYFTRGSNNNDFSVANGETIEINTNGPDIISVGMYSVISGHQPCGIYRGQQTYNPDKNFYTARLTKNMREPNRCFDWYVVLR